MHRGVFLNLAFKTATYHRKLNGWPANNRLYNLVGYFVLRHPVELHLCLDHHWGISSSIRNTEQKCGIQPLNNMPDSVTLNLSLKTKLFGLDLSSKLKSSCMTSDLLNGYLLNYLHKTINYFIMADMPWNEIWWLLWSRLPTRHMPLSIKLFLELDNCQTLPRLTVTQIYKIRSKIWMAPSPRNLAAQISKLWHNFAQLRDLIASIYGTQQDIVNRKTALQTTDNPAQGNLIWWTLVHKWRKTGPEFSPTQQAGHCHASSFVFIAV